MGLAKEWDTPLTKAEVLKCLDCHAPAVNYASEELAVEIGNLIVTAFEKKGSSEGSQAAEELAKLNVGCYSCHNIKATSIAPGLRGKPKKGVIYGPNGEDGDDFHESIESVDISTSAFCMQCHGVYHAPDGETIQCNTLSGSYRHGYLAAGGSKTCQECHPDATANFSDAWTSHFKPSLENNTLVYLVNLFYMIIIPLTLGAFLFLIGTDVFHWIRVRLQKNERSGK